MGPERGCQRMSGARSAAIARANGLMLIWGKQPIAGVRRESLSVTGDGTARIHRFTGRFRGEMLVNATALLGGGGGRGIGERRRNCGRVRPVL